MIKIGVCRHFLQRPENAAGEPGPPDLLPYPLLAQIGMQLNPTQPMASTSGPAVVVPLSFKSFYINCSLTERISNAELRDAWSSFPFGITEYIPPPDNFASSTPFRSAAIERFMQFTPSTASTSGPPVVSGLDQDLVLMRDLVHCAWEAQTLSSAGQIPPPVPMVLEPSPSFVSPSNPSTAKVCQS